MQTRYKSKQSYTPSLTPSLTHPLTPSLIARLLYNNIEVELAFNPGVEAEIQAFMQQGFAISEPSLIKVNRYRQDGALVGCITPVMDAPSVRRP